MKNYTVPPKLEKHLRKNKKAWSRRGMIAILTYSIALIVMGVIGKSCWDGYWRTHSWRFQSPVIFQTPIVIKEIKPLGEKVVSPIGNEGKIEIKQQLNAKKPTTVTERDIVMAQPHGAILWNIYMLESTRGKNDICRNSGKGWGGFGVIGVQGVQCYESFELAVKRAEYWISKLHPDKNLASALCQYNLGIPNLVNCNYYQNYLSL